MQQDPLIPRMNREFRNNEADAIAGLWVRHEPDFGVTVAFTGDPQAAMKKVRRYVEGTQWEQTVRIKHAEPTQAELKTVRAKADRTLERLGLHPGSGMDLSGNRVEFYLPDEAAFERRLRASDLELADHVIVKEDRCFPLEPEAFRLRREAFSREP